MINRRVPNALERALFAAAIIYAIIPFDFIPDALIPDSSGQIDRSVSGLSLCYSR